MGLGRQSGTRGARPSRACHAQFGRGERLRAPDPARPRIETLVDHGVVGTLVVGGGLSIGEVEWAAAEQIGLQRNPGCQDRADLNDQVGAGRAGYGETKRSVRDAKRPVGGDAKGVGTAGLLNRAF